MSALTGQDNINHEAARKQRAQVLYMLKRGMRFTQDDVSGSPYFIKSVSSRVSELRKLGFPIQKTRVTQNGVSGIVQYSLTETKDDTKQKRYLLNRLMKGEILNIENAPEMDEATLDKYIRWLFADGWPVLIVDVDGVKSRLYVMARGATDGD